MPSIEYALHPERSIPADKLRLLYDQETWWPERSLPHIAVMLDEGVSVGAWYGNYLVGFARAISDGCFRAYIEDVVVHRDFHRAGIGTELMNRLLAELEGIDVISLFCDRSLIPFYEERGFQTSSQVVMHLRIDEE